MVVKSEQRHNFSEFEGFVEQCLDITVIVIVVVDGPMARLREVFEVWRVSGVCRSPP